MDRRLRELERQWKEHGDTNAHGALLRHLLRTGEISNEDLALGAFLGHEGCLKACQDVRPDGIILRDKLLKNIEMRDFCLNLKLFNKQITSWAGYAVCKLIDSIVFPKTILDYDGDKKRRQLLIHHIKKVIESRNESSIEMIKANARMSNYRAYRDAIARLQQIIEHTALRIVKDKYCEDLIFSASIEFPDEDFRGAIRNELMEHTLGEYS